MNVDHLNSNTPLKGPGGPDSLETVELVMAIEEAFDIEIPDEDAEKFRTIGDISVYVEQHARKRDPKKSVFEKIRDVIQHILTRIKS
jgi:acyl carrier protein